MGLFKSLIAANCLPILCEVLRVGAHSLSALETDTVSSRILGNRGSPF